MNNMGFKLSIIVKYNKQWLYIVCVHMNLDTCNMITNMDIMHGYDVS